MIEKDKDRKKVIISLIRSSAEFYNPLMAPFTIQKIFTCQLTAVVRVITGHMGIVKEDGFKMKFWTCLIGKLIVLIISK